MIKGVELRLRTESEVLCQGHDDSDDEQVPTLISAVTFVTFVYTFVASVLLLMMRM